MLPLYEEDRRVIAILAPDQDLEWYPEPSLELLEKYMNYLKIHIPAGIWLTGREDTGQFSWETRFVWGDDPDSDPEYIEQRKQRASFQDTYRFNHIVGIADEWDIGILIEIIRKTDGAKFHLPLHDFEGKGNPKEIDLIIEDYSSWAVNHYHV